MTSCCYLQHGGLWCQGVAIYLSIMHIYNRESRGVNVLLSTAWGLVVSRCCYLQHGESWCQGVAIYSLKIRGVKVLLLTA